MTKFLFFTLIAFGLCSCSDSASTSPETEVNATTSEAGTTESGDLPPLEIPVDEETS